MIPIKKIIILLILSSFAFSQNRKADSLTSLLSKQVSDTGKVKLLNEIGRAWRKTDAVKARDYYNQALQLSTKTNDKTGIHLSLINIGRLNCMLGNFQNALDSFLNPAIELARQKELRDQLGTDLCFKGDALIALTKLPEALTVEQEALKLFEADKKDAGISTVKISMGNIYYSLNQPAKSLQYYEEAYEIRKKLNDEIGQIACLVNMIGMTSVLKDHGKAILYAKTAEKLCEKTGDKTYLPIVYQNLSNTFNNLNLVDSALLYYNKAITIHRATGNLYALASGLVGKARAYGKIKKYKEALASSKEALDIGKKIQDPEILMQAFEMMGSVNFWLGNFRDAYLNTKLYDSLKGAVMNIENSRQINEMQAKFETVKKDKELLEKESEIKLQQKENQQRSRERNGFIIGFVIMIVLAVFIFRSLQQNRKANKIITAQKEEVEKQKHFVEEKNNIIEEKQKEILDSIHYAKRIQKALMPNEKFFDKELNRVKKKA